MANPAAPPVSDTDVAERFFEWIEGLPEFHELEKNVATLQEEVQNSAETLREEHRASIDDLRAEFLDSIKATKDEICNDLAALRLSQNNFSTVQSVLKRNVGDLMDPVKDRADDQTALEFDLGILRTQVYSDHRAFICFQNARAIHLHSVLQPVRLPNGNMPENFPATNFELANLSGDSCTRLLESYELASEGSEAVKRRRLAEWLGVNMQLA